MAAVSPLNFARPLLRALPTAREGLLGELPLVAGIDLPRGAVVELCAPTGLGRMTQLALDVCAAAQTRSRALSQTGDCRWCGWLDPTATLYAPAVARAGVALERLLVARPEVGDLGKIAVRMAASRVFSVLVIDRAGVPGALVDAPGRWDVTVRRLALACETTGDVVLLLSDIEQARRAPLPVAMRVELSRPSPDRLHVRVTKDRRGQLSAVSCQLSAISGQRSA